MQGGDNAHGADAEDIARRSATAMWEADATSRGLGMAIEHIAPGEADLSMSVRGDMVNGHDICHGGFIFTLADSAFAYACNTYNQVTVAHSCEIVFLQSGKLDERLTARAREVYRLGRNGVYDVTVTNQAGEKIALFRGKSRTVKGEIVPAGSLV